MRPMRPAWREVPALAVDAASALPMQQHPIYAAACTELGTQSRNFELPGAAPGHPLATALVLERRLPVLGRAALLSRGPVWHAALPAARKRAELRSLVDILRTRHRLVAMTPEAADTDDVLEECGGLAVVTPCHLGLLELAGDEGHMRSRQHGKWRNRLVRAERHAEAKGLRIHHGAMTPDPAHWLFRAEEGQAKSRRYRRLPTSFTLAWLRAGGSDSARIFVVEQEGAAIAAMLFLLHGACASYHIGWSGREGRAVGAHNLLLWEAQRHLAQEGFRQIELDLIDTRATPGLARFKIGSGARVVSLGATRLWAPGTRWFARRSVACPGRTGAGSSRAAGTPGEHGIP